MKTTHSLGVDVATCDAKKLMRELSQRKTTLSVEGPFPYRQENTSAQIHIETTLSESELDDWLWRVHHKCDYVGVFQR